MPNARCWGEPRFKLEGRTESLAFERMATLRQRIAMGYRQLGGRVLNCSDSIQGVEGIEKLIHVCIPTPASWAAVKGSYEKGPFPDGNS